MNADFKLMSDLLADAEDLAARVAQSQTPEVRALSKSVQLSVDHVREHLRERARGLLDSQEATQLWLQNPLFYIAAGTLLAAGLAALLRRKSKLFSE